MKLISTALAAILIALSGCMSNSGLQSESVSESNVSNLTRISVGMSQAQVLNIMHSPYKTQNFQMDSASFDVWFYVTKPSVLGQSRMVPMNLTPLAFKNGVLIGWGYAYYNYLSRRQRDAESEKNSPKAVEKPQQSEDSELENALKNSIKPST